MSADYLLRQEAKQLQNICLLQYKNTQKTVATQLSSIEKAYAGNPTKMLEQKLAWMQKNNPELYKTAHKNIVELAAQSNNPLYKSFMNNEINGLGSYFSKDYMEIAGLKSAPEIFAPK
jgi:hypothetical protein